MSTQQFGGWLKHAREARGLTVEAVVSQTKISRRHLEALERGDTLAIPAFYQRAEVRAVARAVGVDERLAVERLEAELAPVQPQAAPSTPAHGRSKLVLANVGMTVLVLGLAGWGTYERRAVSAGGPEGSPPQQKEKVETPSAPLQSEAAKPAAVETVAAPSDAAIAPAGPPELDVWTQPRGARVTVNGIGWGQSPLAIRHLEPGVHRIRVTMDGYVAAERSVVIDEGRHSVSITLRPK